jgi:DNA-binding PadR family transcriptional regulator
MARPNNSSSDHGGNDRNGMAVPWGRSASPYRPGLFSRGYFLKHHETCAAEIYSAMSESLEHLNEERIFLEEKPIRRPNYNSFSRYFHYFLILGLIERTGRQEPAAYPFLKKKVYYRLTHKGRTELRPWQDPVRSANPTHDRQG